MNQASEDAETEIREAETISVQQIPFYFFQKHKNKTTKLLANSGEVEEIDGRNVAYNYELKKPFFISHIEVSTVGYRDYDYFEFSYRNQNGQWLTETERPKDGKVEFQVADICDEIEFTPPSAWFRTTRIREVRIFGFKHTEVASFIKFADRLDAAKSTALNEINRAKQKAQSVVDKAVEEETRLNEIRLQIAESEMRSKELTNEISSHSASLEELIAKEGSAKKQLEAIEERISGIRTDINLETKRREETKSEVATEQTKLARLKADIDLFPTEISGFAKQSGTNIRWYLGYAAIPIALLVLMFCSLILGAADLTTVITKDTENVNILALIVSRLPYVLIASAIIYASYRITRLFISEVMNINRQRLSLTKISIIAKDISQSAEHDLELDDSQIYHLRLRSKMAMLGDHIKHLISSEPELLIPENIFPATPLLGAEKETNDETEEGLEEQN